MCTTKKLVRNVDPQPYSDLLNENLYPNTIWGDVHAHAVGKCCPEPGLMNAIDQPSSPLCGMGGGGCAFYG